MADQPVGVLLITFGTARSADEVPQYLSSVRGGREVPPELITEFQRRFALVGGSPLIEITQKQAAALESRLKEAQPDAFVVGVGMRHSPPTIVEGLRELRARSAQELVGIILAPQFSERIMGGYLKAVAAAEAELNLSAPVRVVRDWHAIPAFTEALAQHVQQAWEGIPHADRSQAKVVFTAHSLPKSVADNEPQYLEDLRDTAQAVANRVGLDPRDWEFAFQSAGHTQEEWLKPDLTDVFPRLRDAGIKTVLVAPVQFLSDHLEILYDIDVAAREQADAAGLRLLRIASLNTAPLLIEAMAAVVHRALETVRS